MRVIAVNMDPYWERKEPKDYIWSESELWKALIGRPVSRGATTSIFLQNTEYRQSVKTLRHVS